MDIAVVLNTHENSPVFRDTLDSVRHHWTDDILVVVDGKAWAQFHGSDLKVAMLEGFRHGRASAPYRNVCLGMMKAWERWGTSKGWYCYMEYDCLVGSSEVEMDLNSASKQGFWMLGNDHRMGEGQMPFLDHFQRRRCELHYLLGCCVFMSRDFLSALHRDSFFERFLTHTNFFPGDVFVQRPDGKSEMVYDLSEFLYPSLAVLHGGRVGELACWEGSGWRGLGDKYPMRFRPDLDEGGYERACVMHPLKSDGQIRSLHRHLRTLTGPSGFGSISAHARL